LKVKWKPSPKDTSKFYIQNASTENVKAGKSGEKQQSSGILIENLPAGAITNAGKYIPPHLRGNNIIGITLNL
jgi:hypothetical protein